MDRRHISFAAVAFCLFPGSNLHAAVRVHQFEGSYMAMLGSHNSDSVLTSGDKRKRVEKSAVKRVRGMSMEAPLTIERADLGKVWKIDPARKRYTEASMEAAAAEEKPQTGGSDSPSSSGGDDKPIIRLK